MGLGSYGGGTGKGESPADGKSKSSSGGGKDYSGKGGSDSPSEGGPGPGGGGGKSSGGGAPGGGGGNGGGKDYSGKGGQDSPSEGGKGPGGGSKGPGGGGKSSGGGNHASERGRDTSLGGLGNRNNTGLGGMDSPSERNGLGPGKGLNSPSRPDNMAAAGPKGLGGKGGLYVGGAPVDQARARMDMAQSMEAVGIRSLAGKPAPASPSHRQSEIQSMTDLAAMKAPSHRATEIASLDKMRAWDGVLGLARRDAAKVDPYNSLTYGKKGVPTHASLTDMTIAEVMEYQKGMKKAGHASTAVGAYQTVASTLADAVQLSGLPLDAKFSPATQDFLAMGLVERRASFAKDPKTGVVDVNKFADQLTKEWASFKNATGKSSYEGFNNNKGYVDYNDVRNAAANLVGSGTIGGKATAALGSVPGAKQDRVGFQDLPTVGPTPTPADRFRDTYLSKSDKELDRSLANPEVDYFGQQPSSQYDRNPAGIPVGGANSPAGSTPPASPSLAGPATTGPATTGPATTGPAGSVAPGAPAPAAAPDKPYQRSTAGSIMAGAIDVGLGMTGVPGIGIGLLNAGLSLTGRNTIGESIVDRMAQGKDINTGSTESKGDFTRARQEAREAAGKETPKEIEEPVITSQGPVFIDKYLRPTPKERFLDGREAYAGREYPETRTA